MFLSHLATMHLTRALLHQESVVAWVARKANDARQEPSAHWMIRGSRGPTHGPNGGVADSLDEAKAAFRAF